MIRIETKRVVERGEKFYEVTGFEALAYSELPNIYTSIGPSFYYDRKDGIVSGYTDRNKLKFVIMKVGEKYSKEEFEDLLDFFERCGTRLRAINKQLRQENACWTGEVTFII